MIIVCWYEYVSVCKIACVWLYDAEEEAVRKPVVGKDRVLLYVLTWLWEEGVIRKPVAGKDRILCVLIYIGVWEEETARKWLVYNSASSYHIFLPIYE